MSSLIRFVVCGACMAALFVSTSAADEGAGRHRVLNFAPAEFEPANNAGQYTIEEGGLGRLCPLRGAGHFVVAVHLNDGAVIEGLSVTVEDRSAISFGMMSLVRRTPEKAELLAITPISKGEQVIETLSTDHVNAPVVDGQTYSYLLQVMLSGPDTCLCGAQVTYQVP